MALAEAGIFSAAGSAIATIGGFFGGGNKQRAPLPGALENLQQRFRDAGLFQPGPDLPGASAPTSEPQAPAPGSPILQPTIFAIQRDNVCRWLAEIQNRTAEEVCNDPRQQLNIDELVECLVQRGDLGAPFEVEICADAIIDRDLDLGDLDTEPRGPILARTGVNIPVPPVRRGIPGPTDQPVIRPRDRTSPTEPQVTGPEGPVAPPGVFPPLQVPPEIDFEEASRILDQVALTPIPELFPVRLPTVPRRPVPDVLEPLPQLEPVEVPAIPRLPVPTRTPAPTTAPPLSSPTRPGLPGSVVGAVVGTVTGAGILTARPGASRARGASRTALPDGALPDLVPQPAAQAQRLSQRIDECPTCEKEAPEEPREVCVHGLYKEQVLGTEFIGWSEYDCITGEWLRDLER